MRRILPWVLPMFRTTLFILGGWLFVITTGLSYTNASHWWSLLCTFFNLITIVVLLIVCRYEGITFRSLFKNEKEKLNFKKTAVFTIIMLLIGVGGMIGFSLLFYQGLPEFLIQPIPVWIAIINLFLLPITIVFAEFPLYFGYSLKYIKKNTLSPTLAILYTVFFYALQHSFIPLLWDFKYMAFRFLSFLPLMIFLGIQYHKKNNLGQMMIGHGVMDLSTGMQILIMSIL